MTPTRRALVAMTGAIVATEALDNLAKAETVGPRIKAVGFDAFTIFDPRSVRAAVEESVPGRGGELYAAWLTRIDLTTERRAGLMDAYLQLKPWPDSAAALKAMRNADIRLAYVSNFTPTMLKRNSEGAGIADLFEHSLSTDIVKAFKPDPRAYQMAETAFKVPRENIVFAAFGGWDAAGAKSFGLNTFWVNRLNVPLEELGVKPNAEGGTLTELAKYVTA
jgi:2-haloacid dehalogenase